MWVQRRPKILCQKVTYAVHLNVYLLGACYMSGTGPNVKIQILSKISHQLQGTYKVHFLGEEKALQLLGYWKETGLR